MGPACLGLAAQVTEIAKVLDDLVEGLRIATGFAQHLHPLGVLGIATDRTIDPVRQEARRTEDDRAVFLVDLAILEGGKECIERGLGLGEDHEPAGVFVESVHDAAAALLARRQLEAAVLCRRVREGAAKDVAPLVCADPDRLVDDEDVIVFVHDDDRRPVAPAAQDVTVYHLDRDLLPERQSLAGSNEAAVDAHASRLDQLLGVVARDPREARDRLVEPRPVELRRDLDSERLSRAFSWISSHGSLRIQPPCSWERTAEPLIQFQKHPSILLVEDEAELGSSVANFLREQGFDVEHVTELATALARLDAGQPIDLVISDIYLDGPRVQVDGRPGGLEVAAACDARTPRLPVILLTGRPSMGAALQGLREHVFDFLTKPFELAELAQLARRAIEYAQLRRRVAELEEVNQLLSRILPNAIEAKDPLTRGHSDRVARYSDTLGRRCGLDEDTLRDLALASHLHDVGKIGIPGSILTKEGPLTKDEREEIKKHPAIGKQILGPLQHMPRVVDWVYQHHERWDGRGYPDQLAGEDIALAGRILILAEVYDALATARSYKQAWPDDKIADFFVEDARNGGHFDPELALMVADGVRNQGATWFRSVEDSGQTTLF